MAFFLDLLDKALTRDKRSEQAKRIDDAQITGIGDDGLSLRLPDNSAQSQILGKAFTEILGSAPVDVTTNPTKLNLQGLITRTGNGNLNVDFTSLGGRVFNGTESELANVRGQDLIDLIGNAAAQNSAGGTLKLNSNTAQGQNPLPNILGGERNATAPRVTSSSDLTMSERLNTQLGSFVEGLDDTAREEFLQLFRAGKAGG